MQHASQVHHLALVIWRTLASKERSAQDSKSATYIELLHNHFFSSTLAGEEKGGKVSVHHHFREFLQRESHKLLQCWL